MALVNMPPARSVQANRMVLEPIDFFLGDGVTRATGLLVSDLQLDLSLNGTQLAWPLTSGAGIPDVRVAAGKVYWTEPSAGFYNIRFYPNVIGLWRVILAYPAEDQTVSFTYDVVPQAAGVGSIGIKTSFFRG